MTAALALILLLLLIFRAFALFGSDKARARAGTRRISESTLLQAAF